MSSDLWEAFGDSTSTQTNPWADSNKSKAPQATFEPQQSISNAVSPPDTSTPGPGAKEDPAHGSDADSWSAVNQELESAWSQPAPKQNLQQSDAANKIAPKDDFFEDDDFGDFEEAENEDVLPKSSVTAETTHQSNPTHVSVAESEIESLQIEDDFGDFEEADTSEPSPPTKKSEHTTSGVTEVSTIASGSVSKPVSSPSRAPASVPVPASTSTPLPVPSTSSKSAKTPADDFDLLGDEPLVPRNQNETTAQQSVSATNQTSTWDPFADLEQLSAPQAKKKPADTKQNTTSTSHSSTKSGPSTSQNKKAPLLEGFVVAEVNPDPDEKWDDFSEPSTPAKKAPQAPGESSKVGPSVVPATAPSSVEAKPKPTPKNDASPLPPSNIPPPSILLPLISNIVRDLPEEIEVMIRNHEEYKGDKSALTRTLDLLSALEDRMGVLKVAARILAGRKLRWKRDMILGQSMRISAAGRPGGMKLTGVDKAESQREDREASEFARMYKKNSGRIRSAVAKMPAQADERPAIPLLTENLLVRALKEHEGALKSLKCCVLCGMRREERVDKIDVDVWDQFAEWWTEHWGHTQCRTFWYSHEQTLQQR